jgi:hypothetical protein
LAFGCKICFLDEKDDPLIVGFILAFVGGNFLYITASEGIIELFDMGNKSKGVKCFQFIILIFGVSLNCLLWFAEKELGLNPMDY